MEDFAPIAFEPSKSKSSPSPKRSILTSIYNMLKMSKEVKDLTAPNDVRVFTLKLIVFTVACLMLTITSTLIHVVHTTNSDELRASETVYMNSKM